MILLTALCDCVQKAAAPEHPRWFRVARLIVYGVMLLLIALQGLNIWLFERDREENLRWQAHMRGDHSRCRRKWPCDVPPEGGPPWRDAAP